MSDIVFMQKALKLARKAALRGEVPVGALVVSPEGQILATGENLRETLSTTLGHAELLALHRASKKIGNWRLTDCTVYVTLEPCVMCAGAIQQSRIGRVVYGAVDPKAGAVESLYKILSDPRLNHQVEVTAGVLGEECAQVLTDFFSTRREEIRSEKAAKVYRHRSSVVVLHDKKILGFKGVDPTSQKEYFFLPGGKIEETETSAQASVRECFEETGYRIRILQGHEIEKKYDFFWDGHNIHCHTIFHLAVLGEEWHEPRPIKDASYHRGVAWVSKNDVAEVFAYNDAILAAVQKLLKRPLPK
jgi:tRNA(adenine34) deaminase